MTPAEKVEWAKRAFEEIARNCEEICLLPVVDNIERRTWRAIAAQARRNIQILSQEET